MASMQVQRGPTTDNRVDSPAAANAFYHNPYDLHHQLPPQQASIQQTGHYGYASPAPTAAPVSTPSYNMRKRKPESQDNERLSKRLSLLNLEKNGHKLYVPVESPSVQSIPEHPGYRSPVQSPSSSAVAADDGMQLDNTKHKVYIYDLDAELSSADENSEGESLPGSPTSGRGRLVFLPDIEKHMYRTRIPPAVLANKEGELAGHDINDMQMVLYSEPSSLTVPREHDSVRKAVLEARARMRQKQKDRQAETEQESRQPKMTLTPPVIPPPAVSFPNFGHANGPNITTNGFGGVGATDLIQNATPWRDGLVVDDDVDAMDMD